MSETNNSFDRASRVVLFLYTFFCCFNQYMKFVGIPVFMFFLLLLLLLNISCKDSIVTFHTDRGGYPISSLLIWLIYAVGFAAIRDNETGWRYMLLLSLNVFGYLVTYKMCRRNQSNIRFSIAGLALGLTSNLIVAFWELRTGRHLVPLTDEYVRRFLYRPLGFFVNTNDFSVVCLSIFLLLIGAVSCRKLRLSSKIGLSVICIATFCMLIISFSTTCVLLLPIILLLSVLFYTRNKRKGKIWFLLMCFATIVMIVIMFGGTERIANRFFKNVEFSTVSGRTYLWNNAIKLLWDSYGFGIGTGQSSVIGVGLQHNLALEILSEYGIAVFLILLFAYIRLIKFYSLKPANYFNCVGLSFLITLIPLSVATSSITKLFPVWIVLGIFTSYEEEESIYDTDSCTDLSYAKKSI